MSTYAEWDFTLGLPTPIKKRKIFLTLYNKPHTHTHTKKNLFHSTTFFATFFFRGKRPPLLSFFPFFAGHPRRQTRRGERERERREKLEVQWRGERIGERERERETREWEKEREGEKSSPPPPLVPISFSVPHSDPRWEDHCFRKGLKKKVNVSHIS